MHDISSELQSRAERIKAQISAENARFEALVRELKTKQEDSLSHLKAQRRLANKLLEFTDWQDRLRAELAARIAAAEAAEDFIKKSSGTDG
jgi:hypothetical protein